MKILLKISTLKAAAICAAKNDVRYYLNGVCVDVKTDSKLVIVGTDGYLMFIGVEDYEGEWNGKQEQIIIPIKTVKHVLKNCNKKLSHIALETLLGGEMLLNTSQFKPIDGKYPDYKKVIPKVESLKAGIGHYNPSLVSIGNKAMIKASGNEYPTLNQHGKKDAAVITCYLPNYICVVAPYYANPIKDYKYAYKGIELPD